MNRQEQATNYRCNDTFIDSLGLNLHEVFVQYSFMYMRSISATECSWRQVHSAWKLKCCSIRHFVYAKLSEERGKFDQDVGFAPLQACSSCRIYRAHDDVSSPGKFRYTSNFNYKYLLDSFLYWRIRDDHKRRLAPFDSCC